MTSQGPVRVTVIPTEVVRIGAMASTLLQEAQQMPIDEAARRRLEEAYEGSVRELVAILPGALGAELEHFALPFEHELPTQDELRVAQTQLVGWLEGLFHGIRFVLDTQLLAARHQFHELRRRDGQAAGHEPVPSSGAYL